MVLRGARYFDSPPTKRPCFLCASLEHVAKQCPRLKDCPDDNYSCGVSTKTAICLRCGGLGHDMVLCKYEYTEDDLKDIQCYVCRSFGHLCCVDSASSWAVSCYRCGQLGHVGLACGRHYKSREEEGHFSSDIDRIKQAEKKKRRIEKAIAISAAIRAKLEKKKQRKIEEQREVS